MCSIINLHNFGYNDRRAFEDVDAIIFPSDRMANTPDPRDFYKVTRAVLMPSLWRESLGRVPIEAMANGIPVLASDRGALPETLGDAGFVFTIPDRCTPTSGVVPTAQ